MFAGVAQRSRIRLPKGISLLTVVARCWVLRGRWCQHGVRYLETPYGDPQDAAVILQLTGEAIRFRPPTPKTPYRSDDLGGTGELVQVATTSSLPLVSADGDLTVFERRRVTRIYDTSAAQPLFSEVAPCGHRRELCPV